MSRPQVYINRELPAARRLVTTASPRHRVTNAFQQTNIGLYAALTDSPGRAGYRGSTPPVPPKRCSEPLSGVPAVHPPDSPRRAESALTAPLSVLFRRYAEKPHVHPPRAPERRTGAFPLPDWASPDMYACHALRTCPDLWFYRHVYANTYISAYTYLIAYTAMKRAATLRHPTKCPTLTSPTPGT